MGPGGPFGPLGPPTLFPPGGPLLPFETGGGGGGRHKARHYTVNKKVLDDCTKKLFGVTTDSFSAATPGSNGAPGTNGSFSGTQSFDDGLKYSFSILTDVNSYTAQPYYKDDQMKLDLGYTSDTNYYVNYVSYGLNTLETLQTQLIETGNGLYGISGTLTTAQIHARDNSPNPNTNGPGANDAPGRDLLDCLNQNGGIAERKN